MTDIISCNDIEGILLYIYHIFADINECKQEPCYLGSKCLNIYNGFICICQIDRNGTLCENRLNLELHNNIFRIIL